MEDNYLRAYCVILFLMIVNSVEILYQVIQGWGGGGMIKKGVGSSKETCSVV